MPKNPKNADLDPRECHEFVVLVPKEYKTHSQMREELRKAIQKQLSKEVIIKRRRRDFEGA